MKLITELSEDIEFVSEAKENGEKDFFIEGRFIVGDVKNKNGRMYPMDILRPEVDRYVTEMVNTGRALGECGHPSGPTVNLERVSHRILKLREHRGGFEGKALVTKTPMGNIVKGLLESGAKIGVSTRGMGSLKENNGTMEVQKDFKLATIDCVSDPSGPSCFINGILEGVEYFYDDARGSWKEEKVQEIKESVKKMSKRQIEENALSVMEDYFSLLIDEDAGKNFQQKALKGREEKFYRGRKNPLLVNRSKKPYEDDVRNIRKSWTSGDNLIIGGKNSGIKKIH